MAQPDHEVAQRPTFLQRHARRRLAKAARKHPDEPLTSEDWAAYFYMGTMWDSRVWTRVLRSLPHNPRCSVCGAPFEGIGSRLTRPLGYRPSRKNPNICATCVELAPPGGMTMEVGVMFADLRGFTAMSDRADPEQVSALLRRFYASAEKTLFPEALIDKLIGDEVMALYVPYVHAPLGHRLTEARVRGDEEEAARLLDEVRTAQAGLMVEQAEELLESVGYGSDDGPFVELGIGLDYGEAHVGNIGDRAVFDFTAVGDVVNMASRLQGQAGSGEILISSRLADSLDEPPGEPVELEVKGKEEPIAARRLAPYLRSPAGVGG